MTPARTVAATVCATRSGVSVSGLSFRTFTISKKAAPEMAGTAISRLNPTAQLRDNPRARAAATVSPLRLTPGRGANICAIPIRRASSHDISRGPLSPPLSRAVSDRTAAVIRNPIPAATALSNVWSIRSLRNSLSGMSGRVATTASSPTRITAARRYAGGTSVEPSSPRAPVLITGR